MDFNYDGAAQSLSLDKYNNVIYWANFAGSSHRVIRTLLSGQTVDLNITYPGAIVLTSDDLYFYVLDKDNNRVDKFSKETLEKQGNFTYSGAIHDMIIAYGKFSASRFPYRSKLR